MSWEGFEPTIPASERAKTCLRPLGYRDRLSFVLGVDNSPKFHKYSPHHSVHKYFPQLFQDNCFRSVYFTYSEKPCRKTGRITVFVYFNIYIFRLEKHTEAYRSIQKNAVKTVNAKAHLKRTRAHQRNTEIAALQIRYMKKTTKT
jgi:hypothetical protein